MPRHVSRIFYHCNTCIMLTSGRLWQQSPRVGLECSRPAHPRHLAQALHFARYRAGGLLRNVSSSRVRSETDGGFRRIRWRKPACSGPSTTARLAVPQPSVVSLQNGDEICLAPPTRILSARLLPHRCGAEISWERSRRSPLEAHVWFSFGSLV